MNALTHQLSLRCLSLVCGALLFLRAPLLFAEPSLAALAAFNTYVRTVESRLAQQHRSPDNFLILPTDAATGVPGQLGGRGGTGVPGQLAGRGGKLARLRSGQLLIEQITTPTTPDALLHHWRATAFVANATLAGFERLLRNFSAYPQIFAPQIVSSTVISHIGVPSERSVFAGATTPSDTLLRLRTRQHHVITVVLDTTVDVSFASLDPTHGYSISRSTCIDQIAPSGDGGFLYRLNTYWTYEQRDGGLYLQIESLSLTRSIPRGLAWAVQPYLESIPRESLVFTLTSARNALRKHPH